MGRILIVGFAVLPKPKINPRWEAQAHLPSFLLALQRFAGDSPSRPSPVCISGQWCLLRSSTLQFSRLLLSYRCLIIPLEVGIDERIFFFTLICRSFNFYSCRSGRTVTIDWQLGNVRGGRELVKSTFVSLLIFTQK